MDKIYPYNNYLVIEKNGLSYFFPQKESVFYINESVIYITTTTRIPSLRVLSIDISDIESFVDETGRIQYTYSTLIELLTNYTSKICNFD